MTVTQQHIQPELLQQDQAIFLAQALSLLSDPTRLRIVFALTQGEQTVSALVELVECSQPAVSHHLARLRAQRLVRTRREGNHIFYEIDDRHVGAMIREALCHLDHIQRGLPDHRLQSERSEETNQP